MFNSPTNKFTSQHEMGLLNAPEKHGSIYRGHDQNSYMDDKRQMRASPVKEFSIFSDGDLRKPHCVRTAQLKDQNINQGADEQMVSVNQ